MFKNARIKLTAWYLIIIMLVSVTFSLFIHRILVIELERFAQIQKVRIERKLSEERHFAFDSTIPPPPRVNPELIQETKGRITIALLLINTIILFFSGITGYLLAGKTLQPIREMVDEQNRFVSDASHELRTPLTALKTAMEVALRNNKFNLNEAKKLIKENISEVNKLETLSGALLQLSQSQQQRQTQVFQNELLDIIIKEAVLKTSFLAKAKTIKIINQTTKHQIFCDKDSLVELFVILLDNAIKYSHKNSTITIIEKKIKDKIELVVEDGGIGIAEKDLPYVFDRFYRADSARQKKDSGGFGLGLSIAKEIITRHKGNIFIESEIDNKTEVHIVLPIVSMV